MIPEKLSHYRIIKKLGAGGMGEVHLAEDIRLGRRVALKVLSATFASDSNQLLRFEQEARAASALNHPNIITIYEVGEDKETRFIATEYVEGETLRQYLMHSTLGLREALDIAAQVAGALAAAHQAGIIHRDIKPENVMLRPDGYVKVLDFGIAKLTESFTERRTIESESAEESTIEVISTDANVILGSPCYMSPEQARGLAVDARTDIFSLGATLYEMLTGGKAFDGKTPSDVIVSVLDREPRPLASYSTDIPEAVEQIIAKALRKEREDRYQSATRLLNDLREARQRIELDVELERSKHSRPVVTSKLTQTSIDTIKESARESLEVSPARTSSLRRRAFEKVARHKKPLALAALVLIVAAAVAFWFFPARSKVALNERDTIMVAEFANMTGDAVFDGTLRQALAVQLEQSPFLNIFSDERIRETLRYMNRPPEERLTVSVAREICQRQGIKALLTGSISQLGAHYVISLEALNAYTGDAIARQQVEAESKEQVLKALGNAASGMREKLGESLRMIERFDAPIEQATTSSLEALKAFSLGNEQQNRGRYLEAIPHYRRAIELDNAFALAHARLAVAYDNSRQPELAAEHAAQAFEMKDRVSERERLFISWRYFSSATREIDRAIEVLELWKQTYPRNTEPHNTLSFYYIQIGQFEKAIEEAQEAIRLNPMRAQPYSNLGFALMCLNRLDEAKRVYEQALAQGLDSTGYHWGLYLIGLMQGDTALMEQRIAQLSGKSNEYEATDWQAKTFAFYGQFEKAKEFSSRAIELARRSGLNEVAAQFATHAAFRAAAVGVCEAVHDQIADANAMAKTNASAIEGALALAFCGDAARALALIDEQSKKYPRHTLLNEVWLPAIKALIEVRRNNAARAIELLETARRYEMGYAAAFLPMYVRGLAYLNQRAGTEAAAEFEKVLNNRGMNANSNLYPLARLGIARAAAVSGDREKSLKAYDEFFQIWKDADQNVPILQTARREYERLK